ncbi:MAG: DUF4235 domain-containing protein [Egibacteraceae bacterium]
MTATTPVATAAASNGLAEHAAAAQAARDSLGRNLETLTTEVRAQMGKTMEETTWKVAATGAGIVAGMVARKVLMAGWRKARHTDPPTNPAARETEWKEALAWTVATGIGVAIARLVAQRGAAAGWEKFTGALPPGLQEVSP